MFVSRGTVMFGSKSYNITVTPIPDGIVAFAISLPPVSFDEDTCNNQMVDCFEGQGIFEAGDINDDGISDIVAYQYSGMNNYGDSLTSSSTQYTILGTENGFPPILNVSAQYASNEFSCTTDSCSSGITNNLQKTMDVNGDGIGDILMVNSLPPQSGSSMSSYEIFALFGSKIKNDILQNNALYFTQNGAVGNLMAALGDINKDGINDFIITGGIAEYNVFFGSTNINLDPSNLNGSNGFVINSSIVSSASGVGDVNGDSIDDFVLGTCYTPYYHCNNTYVIFGNQNGFAQSFDLSSLNGQNGFVIGAGGATDWLGDVNNDGINDIIIATNVIYGSKYEFHSPFNVSTLNGNNGFTIFGTDGQRVSGLGDVNGDKIDDFAIDNYVIFGQSSTMLDGDLNV
jgi:hypothetical protein